MSLYAITKVAPHDAGIRAMLAAVPPFSLGLGGAEGQVLVASHHGAPDGVAVTVGEMAYLHGDEPALSALLLYSDRWSTLTGDGLSFLGGPLHSYHVMQVVPGSLVGQPPSPSRAVTYEKRASNEATPLEFSGDPFTKGLIAAPHSLFAAQDAERTIGWCGVAHQTAEQALLYGVWVAETARRGHIGTALAHHVVSHLFDDGISRVTVIVEHTDSAGVKLVKRLGFKAITTLHSTSRFDIT